MPQDDVNCKVDISALHDEINNIEDWFVFLKRTQKVFIHSLDIQDCELKSILLECVNQWLDCDIEMIGTSIKILREVSGFDIDN